MGARCLAVPAGIGADGRRPATPFDGRRRRLRSPHRPWPTADGRLQRAPRSARCGAASKHRRPRSLSRCAGGHQGRRPAACCTLRQAPPSLALAPIGRGRRPTAVCSAHPDRPVAAPRPNIVGRARCLAAPAGTGADGWRPATPFDGRRPRLRYRGYNRHTG